MISEVAQARFWAKVEKTPTCWNWTGSNIEGYGQFYNEGVNWLAHRLSYALHMGNLPAKGMVTDHLCRNRCCVNPEHLEIVTNKENVLRGEGVTAINAKRIACRQGHPYDDANLAINRNGGRRCRKCSALRTAEYYQRKKALLEAVERL